MSEENRLKWLGLFQQDPESSVQLRQKHALLGIPFKNRSLLTSDIIKDVITEATLRANVLIACAAAADTVHKRVMELEQENDQLKKRFKAVL